MILIYANYVKSTINNFKDWSEAQFQILTLLICQIQQKRKRIGLQSY